MSHQGPIILLSSSTPASLTAALSDAKLFPVIDATWSDVAQAVERLQPAAVVVSGGYDERALAALAAQVARKQPYVPLIVTDPTGPLPDNAISFASNDGRFDRLAPRLSAALRVRTLHATVLRRLDSDPDLRASLLQTDPLDEATVLLIGRGSGYPALSVALGERLGVVGTLSIEGAAKHLNARDLDGIILGEGFSPRVVDAFLTVLSEDARFRNFPILVTVPGVTAIYDLPNLELASGDPMRAVDEALPLIRQHAFEARLGRTLQSIDAGGLLDSRTGLLTTAAFDRDFATAVYHSHDRGSGLSVARFAFDQHDERVLLDAARIVSRLMRKMDFGTLQDDGSIVVVFAATDLRNAHAIARRLSSVMRQTSHSTRRESRIDPTVSVATLLPNDSARAVLGRLSQDGQRAAS
ncbi:GGDEF domain-containing protein [Rhodopseudomonas rhenobacensis]|uniref:GGDEF domain-containing protein n=1 Tax=Rhodopseudomonas rhenobacensis TaxID=87461 RepID=A0A7W7Z0E2_9BRAD|nr:GGDEF domain-containing protein [Rhodopseudomonas rhenobacensis]MBB5045656.1 GGDEF domain-containing protein [Rhodopseudomonas rhenobacensis]